MSIGAGSSSLSVLPESYLPFATQCSDGKYYQVYCVSFTDTPVAASGDVNCSGSSGGFTVAGLPVNEAIGCFVRRSTDGASYSTLGTIEIPATGIGGTTSAITSSGDIGMTVAIGSDGTITAEVVSGEVETDPGAATDPTAFNGIYKIFCAASGDGTVYNAQDVINCKCRNFD
ncbi:MAG TPA: hypothetical protein VFV50_04280, partial [Bdellovibrionales bacterium]|nr:hypothetical protein [Bdellovibrionales bacterium]